MLTSTTSTALAALLLLTKDATAAAVLPGVTEGKGYVAVQVDTIDRPRPAGTKRGVAVEQPLDNMDFFYAAKCKPAPSSFRQSISGLPIWVDDERY